MEHSFFHKGLGESGKCGRDLHGSFNTEDGGQVGGTGDMAINAHAHFDIVNLMDTYFMTILGKVVLSS